MASDSWVEYETEFLEPDLTLGYRPVPGIHPITIETSGRRHAFTITIDPDRGRATGKTQRSGEGEVWLFGCSITMGWPLNDDQTLAWILQEQLENFTLRNYAVDSYGTSHALLQLNELLKSRRPHAVIFTYNPFHTDRNIATPRWMLQNANTLPVFENILYPRAGVQPDGETYIGKVPFFDPFLHQVDPRIVAPDEWYAAEVTGRLFEFALSLSRTHGFRCILALQTGDAGSDRVFAAAKRIGMETHSIAFPITPDLTCAPFDNHPNEIAHRRWADQLAKILETPAAPSASEEAPRKRDAVFIDHSAELEQKESEIQRLASAAEERRIALEEKEAEIQRLHKMLGS